MNHYEMRTKIVGKGFNKNHTNTAATQLKREIQTENVLPVQVNISPKSGRDQIVEEHI